MARTDISNFEVNRMSLERLYRFHEQHIQTTEMGYLHVVSDGHTSNKIIDAMMDAAEVLYHQYGASRITQEGEQLGAPICVQYIPKIDAVIKANISLEKTEGDIYLANPLEVITFFQNNPEYCLQVYLMSDPLNVKFRDLFRLESNSSFDDMIKDTYDIEGLLYAIVQGNFE